MCGFCTERTAMEMFEIGELLFLGKDSHFRMMIHESVRVYRAGMPLDRRLLEKYAPRIVDDRELEIANLVSILRDDVCIYFEESRDLNLPLHGEGKEPYTIRATYTEEEREDTLERWYQEEFEPSLNIRWLWSDTETLRIDSETAFAFITATNIERASDQIWNRLMERLSSGVRVLEGDEEEQSRWGGVGHGHLPEFGDLRLWVRREARRALWDAGQKDLAMKHDAAEDFGPFMSWLLSSRAPEVIPYFDRVEDKSNIGVMWSYDTNNPEWIAALRAKWKKISGEAE